MWCRESIDGPSQWGTASRVKHGIFLLDAVPRIFRVHLVLCKRGCRCCSFIGIEGLHGLGIQGLAKTQQIVTETKRVRDKLDRFQHNFRVITFRLVGRGTYDLVDLDQFAIVIGSKVKKDTWEKGVKWVIYRHSSRGECP